MATPANELDRYASYTYYFELYAAAIVDDLYQYEFIDNSKVGTTRTSPNGNLILNSRCDAFQNIEDVHNYITSPLTGVVSMSGSPAGCVMTIREPNGFSFVDKLQQVVQMNNVLALANLNFALKTMFVGRTPTNVIEQRMDLPLLMMSLTNIEMEFTNEGSIYTLHFVQLVGFDAHKDHNDAVVTDMTAALGTVSRSISFTGRTIQEAVTNFQTNLNGMYTSYYNESGTNKQSRPIVYQVNIDPDISGALDSVNKDYFGSNAPARFAYEPGTKVAAILHDILSHCSALNTTLVGDNGTTDPDILINKKVPFVRSSLQLQATQALITYQISLYNALTVSQNDQNSSVHQYVFDYYFADPGKNVDVLHMDLKVNYGSLNMAISQGNYSMHDKATNASGTLPSNDPKYYAGNLLTPNASIDQLLKSGLVGTSYFNGLQNDVAIMPFVTPREQEGYVTIPNDQLASARLATKAIVDAFVGYGITLTLQIRGHLDLLMLQGNYPNNQKTDLLNVGCFMKVNIFNETQDPTTGQVTKQPFFYTGWYRVLTIENVFSGGIFTQNITMMAVEDPNQTSTNDATTASNATSTTTPTPTAVAVPSVSPSASSNTYNFNTTASTTNKYNFQ